MLEALLGFPFNLGIVALIAWLYRPEGLPFWLPGAVAASLVAAGMFLPMPYSLQFWHPFGLAGVLLATGYSIKLFFPHDSLQKLLGMKLPSRAKLKEALLKAESPEDKRLFYLKMVKEFSQIWAHKDAALTRVNTRFMLTLFTMIFGLIYIFFYLDYTENGPTFQALIEANERLFTMSFEQVYSQKPTESEVNEFSMMMLQLSPANFFVYNSLSVLLVLYVIRRIIAGRISMVNPIGHLSLFKLPDATVFLVIISGALVIFEQQLKIAPMLSIIATNLLIISLFLYTLQGIGIAAIFFEVRLLPGGWILLSLIIFSLLLPVIPVLALFICMMLGVSDFWFNFRKRALQPKAVTDSDNSL